ncbi:hypothetical protein Bca4012_076342 [Brassica carinata]
MSACKKKKSCMQLTDCFNETMQLKNMAERNLLNQLRPSSMLVITHLVSVMITLPLLLPH